MDVPVKSGLKMTAVAAFLGFSLSAIVVAQDSRQQPSQVPDAPAPQPQQAPLTSLTGPIRPGGGAGTESNTSGSADLPMNGNAPGTQTAPKAASVPQQNPQENP